MTTFDSDFDAAKAVADQLKGMDKERQQRILRWVVESLSLDLGITTTSERRMRETGATNQGLGRPSAEAPQPLQHQRPADIKSFVDSKSPKSDVQFAAVVSYFYRFEVPTESRKDFIDAQTLQEAARLAGWRRPPSARATLNNAKKLGYLDTAERGQFQINSVGENLVAMTLPGSQTDRIRKKVGATKARLKNKTKKR